MADRGAVVRSILVGVIALAGACKKSASPGSTAPDTSTTAGADDVDPLADPERALQENRARLRALGVPLAASEDELRQPSQAEPERDGEPHTTDKPKTKPTGNEPGASASSCTEICELASTACDLQTQICRLAEEHAGESRDENACWQATDQCTRGSDACRRGWLRWPLLVDRRSRTHRSLLRSMVRPCRD